MNKEQLNNLVAEVTNAEGADLVRAAINEEMDPETSMDPTEWNGCFTPRVEAVAFVLSVEYFCKGRTRDVYGDGAWNMLCGCVCSLIDSSKGVPGAVSSLRTMDDVEYIIAKVKRQHPELLNN